MKFGTTFFRPIILGITTSLLVVFSVSGLADSWDEHKAKRHYEDAVYFMNKGYSEIGKVVNKLVDDKDSSAMRHFNDAMTDFDLAIEYFAKAELPDSDKKAIESLKKGLEALEESTKAMEKGNMADAQNDYDAAQNYFAEASALMD